MLNYEKKQVLFFSYKNLIALIFYFLERGQRLEANTSDRSLCLPSTSLYFALLSVPGSGAFTVFHPVLYNKALDSFKMATKLQLVRYSPKKKGKKGRSSVRGSTQGSVMGAKPRKRRASSASSFQLVSLFNTLKKI